jgi:hypothetical protein
MSPTRFPSPPGSLLVVPNTGALSADSMVWKSRDLWVLADDEPLIGLPRDEAARRGPVLQDYRQTEKLIPGMNVVPFRHPIYRPPIPPAPSPLLEQLRSRAEARRLVYGVGMFVLGILAHMAWLRVWL